MRISAAFISLAICALSTAQSAVEFGKVKEKYLLLPVSKSSPRRRCTGSRCRINGKFYAPRALDEKKLSFELILDHGIIEAYFDGGAYSQFIGRKASKPGKGFEFSGDAHVDSLEIFTLDSIWE